MTSFHNSLTYSPSYNKCRPVTLAVECSTYFTENSVLFTGGVALLTTITTSKVPNEIPVNTVLNNNTLQLVSLSDNVTNYFLVHVIVSCCISATS